jgi:EmrB/QacA subfamily drug resistance transporter
MSQSFVHPTKRQINLIVVALLVGMFLAALDQMVVTTAIRTIGDDLHGLTLQVWVSTAYMIAATISTPLYGKLSDLYGRKPLYVLALVLFVAGSLLCSTSTSMYQLAAYRSLQGAGAGGLMALAIMILGDLLSPRERTKYQASFFAVWGASSVLGPVIGGFFAGATNLLGIAGWRWIFLVNVPLGVFALMLIVRVLHVPSLGHRSSHIDWSGVMALVVAIVPLLIVLERGHDWGWTVPLSLTLVAISLVGWSAFIAVERRAGDDALLPFRMFANQTVAVATVANFIMGFGMFGGMAGLPLYLQISRGMSPTIAGLAMVPATLGIGIVAIVSTTIIRKTGHYKWITVGGMGLLVIGILILSRVHYDSNFWHVIFGGIVFGAGLGGLMQPMMLAVQNALPPRDNGAGTASVMFSRQIGGSLGAAVFLSLLFGSVIGKIADAFKAAATTPAFQQAISDPNVLATGDNAAVVQALAVQTPDAFAQAGITMDDTSFIHRLDPAIAAPFQIGFSNAITSVMLIAAFVALVGLVVVFFLPSLPLKETSGLQAMADEAELASGVVPSDNDGREPEPAAVPAKPPRGKVVDLDPRC